MATIVLSAVGLAVGNTLGGSVLGLSTAIIGRAAGAALGRSIDERLLGQGSAPVERGRVDRFRLMGASEGAPVAQVFGRMRVAGQVIWASRFREDVAVSGGGKGGPRRPQQRDFSYSVSLAVALCEGEITRVGRVWADGTEVARDDLNLRVYTGSQTQTPDPKMEAVEGVGKVPAYRGMAYVLFEDLGLEQFGNRVPQFSFEVFRPAAAAAPEAAEDMARLVRGVCLIPGTGEYALATKPVYISRTLGEQEAVNVNTPQGKADLLVSLDALEEELPNCGSVILVASWFGDDLRCGNCTIRPKVEQTTADATAMPWTVSGLGRGAAPVVAQISGAAVYGGTPADAAVIAAIRELTARGQKVVFYPFILMDQLAGNALPDPYTGSLGQPALPWRGRITLSAAPGRPGSPDQTAVADAQVATFFGTATPAHFVPGVNGVGYSGPVEWSLRRFILHYAHLCAVAGGVDGFCISTEMRGLTQIRGASGFPAVARLRTLAAEVKAILGPGCQIGYAADWSEYHGYQPEGTADKLFHLDPLWSDPAIDFVGIDNYLPLSDWRDGEDHADAAAGDIHDLDYLTGNVAGGEYYDWYYHSEEARAAQIRTPITDADGEPWVWRAKDIKGWWQGRHHDRLGGVRQTVPSPWVPQSKPIWFTELGCAAIDKGTNEPNKFLDPKSSESALPRYSNGLRDDLIQTQYLRAMHRHFAAATANPQSVVYAGRMLDMARLHVWAWDGRPFPQFPANRTLWSDAGNYTRGHWLNGRTTFRPLDSVVREICARAGVSDVVTKRLHGLVKGYRVDDTDTARAALQPLMLAFGFDVAERDGALVCTTRSGTRPVLLDPERLAIDDEAEARVTLTRAAAAEIAGRIRLSFVDADGDYDLRSSEAVLADDVTYGVAQTDLPLALSRADGVRIAERWLTEARVGREAVRFALPPSAAALGPGDVVELPGETGLIRFRIDRVEQTLLHAVEAVRIEPEVYLPHEAEEEVAGARPFLPPVPVEALFMDLPLLRGDENPVAPHVAMSALPWPGSVALYTAVAEDDFVLNRILPQPATMGVTLTALQSAAAGLWDRGPALRVKLIRGTLASVSEGLVLSGRNVAALGDGVGDVWEVFQFVEAELVAPRIYDLRLRLRGQAGSDGTMPAEWPVGTRFVLLDGVPGQIELAQSARGQDRTYRWGPANRPLDDASFRERVAQFRGIGLRPYRVAHLRATPIAGGNIALGWTRRTRIDGDSWDGYEVPLAETSELYLLRITVNGFQRREVTTTAPGWTYTAAMQAADGATGTVLLAVAQVSDRFGPGVLASIDLGL